MESSFVTSADVAWAQSSLLVVVMSGTVTMQDASSRVGLTGDAPPLRDPRQTSCGSGRRAWHTAWFRKWSSASPWPLGCCGGFLSFRCVMNGIRLGWPSHARCVGAAVLVACGRTWLRARRGETKSSCTGVSKWWWWWWCCCCCCIQSEYRYEVVAGGCVGHGCSLSEEEADGGGNLHRYMECQEI